MSNIEKSVFGSLQNFEDSQRIASAIIKSDIVPIAYRNNIPNTLVAMDMANRVGVPIMTVMQNLDIIHGKPYWSSKFLISMIKQSPKFSKVEFVMTGERGKTSRGCYVKAYDNEIEKFIEGSEVTMVMAKSEGWIDKKGSKWVTMPELMLQYRAGAFFSRIHAPELSTGLLTSDEVQDIPRTEDATIIDSETIAKDINSKIDEGEVIE